MHKPLVHLANAAFGLEIGAMTSVAPAASPAAGTVSGIGALTAALHHKTRSRTLRHPGSMRQLRDGVDDEEALDNAAPATGMAFLASAARETAVSASSEPGGSAAAAAAASASGPTAADISGMSDSFDNYDPAANDAAALAGAGVALRSPARGGRSYNADGADTDAAGGADEAGAASPIARERTTGTAKRAKNMRTAARTMPVSLDDSGMQSDDAGAGGSTTAAAAAAAAAPAPSAYSSQRVPRATVAAGLGGRFGSPPRGGGGLDDSLRFAGVVPMSPTTAELMRGRAHQLADALGVPHGLRDTSMVSTPHSLQHSVPGGVASVDASMVSPDPPLPHAVHDLMGASPGSVLGLTPLLTISTAAAAAAAAAGKPPSRAGSGAGAGHPAHGPLAASRLRQPS